LKDYLKSREDDDGGFAQSAEALDSFGRAPYNTTNAYIVWALTSSGNTDVDKQITSLISGADQMIQENG